MCSPHSPDVLPEPHSLEASRQPQGPLWVGWRAGGAERGLQNITGSSSFAPFTGLYTRVLPTDRTLASERSAWRTQAASLRGLEETPCTPRGPLTRMVVTTSVRLASESLTFWAPCLWPSVMLSPLLEFQIPICTEHRASEAVAGGAGVPPEAPHTGNARELRAGGGHGVSQTTGAGEERTDEQVCGRNRNVCLGRRAGGLFVSNLLSLLFLNEELFSSNEHQVFFQYTSVDHLCTCQALVQAPGPWLGQTDRHSAPGSHALDTNPRCPSVRQCPESQQGLGGGSGGGRRDRASEKER